MRRIVLGILMSVALAACAQNGGDAAGTATTATETTATAATDTTNTSAAAETTSSAAATTQEPAMTSYENKVAEIHTTAGEIDIRFYPDVAPNHVKNFIDLAQKGFYNGTKFHRVIPNFMIQGGDPNTKDGNPALWGTGGSGTNVKAEFNTVSHKRGIVSMARSNSPDSASSQFFIVVADSTFLDRNYTVFGAVTKGMDVADKIVSAKTGPNDRPNDPTTIEKIVIRDARDDEKGPAPK